MFESIRLSMTMLFAEKWTLILPHFCFSLKKEGGGALIPGRGAREKSVYKRTDLVGDANTHLKKMLEIK